MESIRVVDFFSGCGGTSAGLRAAGMKILLGIDNDEDAEATFRENFPQASFVGRDIRKIRTSDLARFIPVERSYPLLFCACAPCQPFSQQRRKKRRNDERASLLWQFVRFVRRYKPDFVLVENVPGLQTLSAQLGPFKQFVATLGRLGYHVQSGVVESRNYGVPQRRRRLVVMASRLGPISFPKATNGPGRAARSYATVWQWIGDLPPIAAGETHTEIANHRASGLSPLNLERIRATPEGGGRVNWPEHLHLKCHSNGHAGHSDVYGRMRKHLPASGLTTRCISLSNGRFGHPTQDRAISVREAACLQTFPLDFAFKGSMASMARQVGNAVPVLLAECFGDRFLSHARYRERAPYTLAADV
jgi:DNA (cytosine-5)-methyltransferase 1